VKFIDIEYNTSYVKQQNDGERQQERNNEWPKQPCYPEPPINIHPNVADCNIQIEIKNIL